MYTYIYTSEKQTERKRERAGTDESVLTFLGDQGLEQQYGVLVASPTVHLPVAIAPLLGQLVPRLGLAEQLAHRALTQPEHVLGEQPLTDIVYRQ